MLLAVYLCFISCFFRVFSIFFCLEKIPLSSHLLNFLCLYEVRRNSYLSSSWRDVLVWEHPYAVYVCPVALVGELDLTWAGLMSSQGELAAITLQGGGAGDGGLELEPGVSHGFSCAQWLPLPYWGRFTSQCSGAETLRVGSKQVLFLLGVHSPPSQQ